MNDNLPEAIHITATAAERLAMLWNELSIVPRNDFNQDHCDMCVIGHGIRSGAMNGFSDPVEEFSEALTWVELADDDVESYLFGAASEVAGAAVRNNWPEYISYPWGTPKDAQKRIEFVLNHAGWDLV